MASDRAWQPELGMFHYERGLSGEAARRRILLLAARLLRAVLPKPAIAAAEVLQLLVPSSLAPSDSA
jgi:hypothetical protein